MNNVIKMVTERIGEEKKLKENLCSYLQYKKRLPKNFKVKINAVIHDYNIVNSTKMALSFTVTDQQENDIYSGTFNGNEIH